MPVIIALIIAFVIYEFIEVQSIVKPKELAQPSVGLPDYNQESLNDVRSRYDGVSNVNFENDVTGTINPFNFYSSYTPPATEESSEESASSESGSSQGGPISEIEDPRDSEELPDLPPDISNITGF